MRQRSMAFACVCILASLGTANALEIKNRTKLMIVQMYASEPDKETWGNDLLAELKGDGIEPDDDIKVADIPDGQYDLKLITDDGTTCLIKGMLLQPGKSFTFAEKMTVGCAPK